MIMFFFQKNWTTSSPEEMPVLDCGSSHFKLTSMMNLNAELEQDDLTILFDEHVLRMSPLVIAAHIKVLCAVVNQTDAGDLADIDIIVGSPMSLPELECKKLQLFGGSIPLKLDMKH